MKCPRCKHELPEELTELDTARRVTCPQCSAALRKRMLTPLTVGLTLFFGVGAGFAGLLFLGPAGVAFGVMGGLLALLGYGGGPYELDARSGDQTELPAARAHKHDPQK